MHEEVCAISRPGKSQDACGLYDRQLLNVGVGGESGFPDGESPPPILAHQFADTNNDT